MTDSGRLAAAEETVDDAADESAEGGTVDGSGDDPAGDRDRGGPSPELCTVEDPTCDACQ